MTPSSLHLFAATAVFSICLASAPVAGQALILETRLALLAGAAAAPSLSAAPSPFLMEGYDASGRLVLLGRSEEGAAAGGQAAKAGVGSVGEAGVGSGGEAPASGPAKPGFREFGYDRQGRLVLIRERAERGGPILSSLRRDFDAEGWLSGVEFRDKGTLSARLELGYEGSGRAGYAFLRSGEGELLETAAFMLGGGAAEGGLLSLDVTGLGGEPLAGLFLDYDAAGRLTRYERRGPAPAPALPAPRAPAPATPVPAGPAPAKAGGEIAARIGSGAEGRGGAPPGIIDLLCPLWPGEAPSFELAKLLALGPGALPAGATSPFASGFSGLPFAPPEEGRAEFLYDGGGRILASRLFGAEPPEAADPGDPRGSEGREEAAQAPLAAVEYRYDEAGLLVEEKREGAAGGLLLLHVYRLGKSGAWIERSSFVRDSGSGLALLKPLEYRERRSR